MLKLRLASAPPVGAFGGWAQHIGQNVDTRAHRIEIGLIAAAAFAIYLSSSFVLDARGAAALFGADTWFYSKLADDGAIGRIADDYHLDRIARFHPTTVALAAIWMKLFGPLTVWIAPGHLLKAMFAAIGALGVGAAAAAFAVVVPRRTANLLAVVYAASLAVWYFSSIEESKIVTGTLSTIYLGGYLRLRQKWTTRGAAFLTAVLLLACLNEIVSGFLLIVPVVDTLTRRGWTWRDFEWIALHALAGPLALGILEGVVGAWLHGGVAHPEGESHLGMLLFYVSKNDFSAESLYSFALNWLAFSFAAPAQTTHALAEWPAYKGYFEPAAAQYMHSPLAAGFLALLVLAMAASWLPPYRNRTLGGYASLLLALLAFSTVRGLFFMSLNPLEPLLFSPAVMLAHLLLIGIPLAASSFSEKNLLLAGMGLLLLMNNGVFILGR